MDPDWYWPRLGFVLAEIRVQLVEQQKCLEQQTEMRVQLLQDLQDFFRKKAEIEMEYSRNLEKLAERFMAKTRSTKDHQQYKWVQRVWIIHTSADPALVLACFRRSGIMAHLSEGNAWMCKEQMWTRRVLLIRLTSGGPTQAADQVQSGRFTRQHVLLFFWDAWCFCYVACTVYDTEMLIFKKSFKMRICVDFKNLNMLNISCTKQSIAHLRTCTCTIALMLNW